MAEALTKLHAQIAVKNAALSSALNRIIQLLCINWTKCSDLAYRTLIHLMAMMIISRLTRCLTWSRKLGGKLRSSCVVIA